VSTIDDHSETPFPSERRSQQIREPAWRTTPRSLTLKALLHRHAALSRRGTPPALPRQGPAKLERHGEHTPARVIVRVLQRILALTALVWHNDRTGGPVADHGKALPTELTDAGRVQLHAASVAVRTIEKQVLAPLTPSAQQRLLADLAACAAALTGEPRTRSNEHTVGD